MIKEIRNTIRALAGGIVGRGGAATTACAGSHDRPRFGIRMTLCYYEGETCVVETSREEGSVFRSILAAHLWRVTVIDSAMEGEDCVKPSSRELTPGEPFDLCYIVEGDETIHVRFRIIEYVDLRPDFGAIVGLN